MDLAEYGLTPLTIEHKPLIDGILNRQDTMLSAYSFTPHYIWRDHFNFYWGIIQGNLCLFSQYGDYLYMPVPPVLIENPCSPPPLPPPVKEGGSTSELPNFHSPCGKGLREGIFSSVLSEVFNIMDTINNDKAVTRIENIDEAWLEYFTSAGLKVRPGESEYVYLRKDLSSLKGARYKSKRAMCNYFEKHFMYRYEPFDNHHAAQCLELYNSWSKNKTQKSNDSYYKALIEDSFPAHREVINNYKALEITGRLVIIDNRVEGYIFGYERGKDIYYILLEIANRNIKGLAQFIFREFCKELKEYTYINALGDSGLENLRNVKLSYRPARIVPTFIAYRD